jgi:hypothetical protein
MTQPRGQSDGPVGPLGAVGEAVGGATRGLRHTIRAIPGVRQVEARAEAGGRFIRGELKKRLDGGDPRTITPRRPPPAITAPGSEPPRAVPTGRPPVPQTLQALLAASMRSSPEVSRRMLLEVLVGELVPDEARILSALSDGSIYALVHIAEPGIGGYRHRVLENASSVGRAAGVSLPEYVHLYVSHLLRIGLVESGPEDHSLKDEYDILLSEPKLRATIAARGKGPRGVRIMRRTVRISDLGRELWETAHPPQDLNDDPPDARSD